MKRLKHPQVGMLALEYAAFAVEGVDGLRMIVFAPASLADARIMETLLSRSDAEA